MTISLPRSPIPLTRLSTFSWIVEDDWKAIAAAGLNHVRIPVPHFAFPETFGPTIPYLSLNRFDKLKEGVLLAKKYGLKVWIDLHSVPGSECL